MAVLPRKNLSTKDVVDLLADDEVESPPTKKPKLDYERIIHNVSRTFNIEIY